MRLFWLLLWFLPWGWSAQAANVHLIEVSGSINPGSTAYILDSLRAAEGAHADALVLRLNTPGGLLSSTREIIQGFSSSGVPVIVWISPGGASATSAGALITLSAHISALAPGTNIGAAHPVGSAGEDVKGTMGVKITSDTAALARAQAVLHGRSPELAEAIVTQSRSFSAEEAVKDHLADFVAADLESLLRGANGRRVRVGSPAREQTLNLGAAQITRVPMSSRQSFLHFIADPNVSAMLISLGGLAIWAEVSSGFSSVAAGVVGIFCIVLGLVSLQSLPVNVGGAVLLGLGFVLLVVEAFVTTSGLLTAAALVSIFLGGLFLIDPASGTMHVSLSLLLPLVASLGAVVLGIGYILARDRGHTGLSPNPLLGALAQVATVEDDGLRGTARVNGELWSFEAAAPVTAGERLTIRSVTGLKIHLERKL